MLEKVLGAVRFWILLVLHSFLKSSHVRKRDKALLRGVLVGGVWSGSCWGGCEVSLSHADSVVVLMAMDIFLGECTYPPLVEIRENPEFHDLMKMDKGHWPRCLLWHGWLPLLSGVNGDSHWAEAAAQGAGHLLGSALGCYSSRLLFEWSLLGGFDAADIVLQSCEHPNVWTDGSLVLDEVSGVSSSGSGFFSHLPGHRWISRRCSHLDNLGPVGGVVENLQRFLLCAFSSSDCSES